MIRRYLISLLFLCVGVTETGAAQQKPIPDPSIVPLRGSDGQFAERYRIVVDLDEDDHKDLILSTDPEIFATQPNIGGPWEVFLWRNGGYVSVGGFLAHPKMLAIERDHELAVDPDRRFFVRIWTYDHLTSYSGGLSYYRVGTAGVEESKAGLIIYTGDGGTELGNGIYRAVFEHSEIPFTVQRSKTDGKGSVTW